MNFIEALILGFVQGLTELLPISSSGHLVLFQYFLNIKQPGLILEVILHMGTLTSICIYFWVDIKKLITTSISGSFKSRKKIYCVFISILPVITFGLLFGNLIDKLFSPTLVISMLYINALILLMTYFIKENKQIDITYYIAFIIGIAQIAALLPGISRSGITISTALILGLNKKDAAKYSFLLAIPILFCAGIYQFLFNWSEILKFDYFLLFISFLTSAFTGYIVIDWLFNIISKGKFYIFSFYCFLVATITLIIIYVK